MPRRSTSTLVVLAALLGIGVGAAPLAAAADVILVGDSVALGAKPQLEAAGVSVDAEVSRSFARGVSVLRDRGNLPSSVIVHLGTNSGVSAAQCDELVGLVGDRRLTLVTVTIPAANQVAAAANAVLASCAARSGATLLDWAGYSRGNPQLLCPDGIHISCGGSAGYTNFVLTGVAPVPPAPAAPPVPPPATPAAAPVASVSQDPAAAESAREAEIETARAAEVAAAAAAEAAAVAAAAAAEVAVREARLERLRKIPTLSPLEVDRRTSPQYFRYKPFLQQLLGDRGGR